MTQTNAIDRLKRAGVSRRAITEACGVTRAAISHWSQGRSVPQGKNFAALVDLAAHHGVVLLASDFAKRHDPTPNIKTLAAIADSYAGRVEAA